LAPVSKIACGSFRLEAPFTFSIFFSLRPSPQDPSLPQFWNLSESRLRLSFHGFAGFSTTKPTVHPSPAVPVFFFSLTPAQVLPSPPCPFARLSFFLFCCPFVDSPYPFFCFSLESVIQTKWFFSRRVFFSSSPCVLSYYGEGLSPPFSYGALRFLYENFLWWNFPVDSSQSNNLAFSGPTVLPFFC